MMLILGKNCLDYVKEVLDEAEIKYKSAITPKGLFNKNK